MDDNELQDNISFRKFLNGKYTFELIKFALSCAVLFAFSYFKFIDNQTSGALLGGIFGYFFSEIRKLHSK